MKVSCLGSRFFGGQIEGVEAGFRALGHEVTPYLSDAGLVYVNDIAHHKQAVADKLSGALAGKLVLNTQDLPFHLGANWDYEGCARLLAHADALTTISAYVQWQVKSRLGFDSTVVFQPIKPVRRDPAARQRPFPRFLSASRRSDFNKRYAIAAAALQLLGYTERDVALVGNEGGWGDYLGVLSDENLNVAYNSADFVICVGKIEGLCLGVCEAMAAGAVPLVCNDLTTLDELLPADLFPEFRYCLPHPASIARFIAHYVNDDSGTRLANLRGRLHDHYRTTWQEQTSPAGVAGRILQAYESTLTS